MRVRKNIKRKREVYLTKSIMMFFSICLVVGVLVFADRGVVKANEEQKPIMKKYYKSIQIEDGDTLWNIANNHKNEESIKAYISDLKEINNLKSDAMTACQYLTVPYYESL